MFHEVFDEQAAETPDVVACIAWNPSANACKSLTYGELRQRSLLLADGLSKLCLDNASVVGGAPINVGVAGASDESILAVQLARTHIDFLPLLVAASRCCLPFVLLSTDLPDKELERERSAKIMTVLKPRWLVVAAASMNGAPPEASTPAVAVESLASEIVSHSSLSSSSKSNGEPPLFCFMFTGGTQRSKVVEVTHRMICFERLAYRDLWKPTTIPAVVLAHTSVYWAASALGQLSIALAYRGTTVWTDAQEANDLRRCCSETGVTVLGIVPDHLDLLAPKSPAQDLPAVEAVFTWGERLHPRIADRWRGHPRACLRELLIATEYWLTLWADPLADSSFSGALRVVPGATLLILTSQGQDAAVGEVGELLISGPMVMAGYREGGADDTFHVAADGRRYFRTRDLVLRVSKDAIVYKGRADMMTKDKGKWVDMLALEDQLSQLPGMLAAKLIPDPTKEHFHAFVALDSGTTAAADVARTVNAARALLPGRAQLWQVPSLPRHPVTRKVDTKRLLRLVGYPVSSWPVDVPNATATPSPPSASHARDPDCVVSGGVDPDVMEERVYAKSWNHVAWTLAAFNTAWVTGTTTSGTQLTLQLILAAVARVGALMFAHGRRKRSEDGVTENIKTTQSRNEAGWVFAWALMAAAANGRLSLHKASRGLMSLGVLTYGWLALTYADEARQNELPWGLAVFKIIDELPFWKFGAFLFPSMLQHRRGVLGWASYALLCSGGASGAVLAAWRRRFFSWPAVFWGLGIGHQLARDGGSWLSWNKWQGHVDWKVREITEKVCAMFSKEPLAERGYSQQDEAPREAREERICARCGANCTDIRWPAKNEQRQVICDECGSQAAYALECTAREWLENEFARIAANQGDSAPSARPATIPQDARVERVEPPSSRADGYFQTDEWLKKYHGLQNWWYYKRNTSGYSLGSGALPRADALLVEHGVTNGGDEQPREDMPHDVKLVCSIMEEVEPLLRPVRHDTIILGLDSLKLARLGNSISARLGKQLSIAQLRESKTIAELVSKIEAAKKHVARAGATAEEVEDHKREYAVWYSPGQYSPMGQWVLRNHDPLNHDALLLATQKLVERHAALRSVGIDPLRMHSFVFDCAVLFSLYGPLLNGGSWLTRRFRRILSYSLEHTWPRVACPSREEVYRASKPETATPFKLIEINGGQTHFETELKRSRRDLMPPGSVTAFEMSCYIVDTWSYSRCNGRFVILRIPAESKLASQVEANLVYVDTWAGEWGPVIGTGDPRWRVAPYGFPALFYVPVNTGDQLWLRLEKADELRVCYSSGQSKGTNSHHLAAFRLAPQRGREVHDPVVVNFVSFCMLHAFADGNCYLPLIQDFFKLYEAACSGGEAWPPKLPPLGNPFQELEKRLFDTFNLRAAPLRSSLRGGIWRHKGRGYGYSIGIEPSVTAAVARAALQYRVPFDLALFGLVICAMARVDGSNTLEFTLYAPMRDGAAENMAVGLFADWRTLVVTADFQYSTVIGLLLQVTHKVLNRQWTVFNALHKPEATVVNIQPLDFQHHLGFVNLGENMWHGGDNLGRPDERSNEEQWTHQPATFVVEQQDTHTWWILVGAGSSKRPPPWMRAYVHAFGEALDAFLAEPLAPVHRPLPSDDELLVNFEQQAKDDGWL